MNSNNFQRQKLNFPLNLGIIGIIIGLLLLPSFGQSRPVHHVHLEALSFESIEALDLLTTNVGWALTQKRLLWTTSGGRQWTDITPPGIPTRIIHTAFFIDVSNGWVLQSTPQSNSSSDISLEIAITHDGGMDWLITPFAAPDDESLKYFGGAASISFVDTFHGWVMVRLTSSSNFSQGALFVTSDGGTTWNKLPAPPIGDPIRFISITDGWLAGGPGGEKLYVTRDGGKSWKPKTVLLPPPATDELRQLLSYSLPTFSDDLQGILPVILTTSKTSTIALYDTGDGGKTWHAFKVLPISNEIGASAKTASSAADSVVVDVAPSIEPSIIVMEEVRRRQNTAEFSILSPDVGISKIDLVNAAEGWVLISVGQCAEFKNNCEQVSKLFATSDGGQTLMEIMSFMRTTESDQTTESAGSTRAASIRISQNQKGFDKCAIASISDMQTWWNTSPYRNVGFYIGGENHSCPFQSLDASWINQAFAMGWGLIPTWVGPQAPCTSTCTICSTMSSDVSAAQAQGIAEADKATDAATTLGLTQRTIIYYDMEKYDETNSSCRAAVNSFVNGWVEKMHVRGNLAGVYGSSYNASDWATIANSPDAVWIAKWDGRETVWGLSPLSDSLWVDHQRIHQHTGGHNETWGGITFNIDNDFVDGPVASPAGTTQNTHKIKLEKRRRTAIEPDNNYSENTTLRATVIFPPGHPRAGRRVTDFNGMITFDEDPGTNYYDGMNGATALPLSVQATRGRATTILKSVSNSDDVVGPIDAGIRATASGLASEDPATNPLSVDQWVDGDDDGFIDWLERHSKDILRCARRQPGEVRTVARRVSRISQSETEGRCGETPVQPTRPTNRSPIAISPVCGIPDNRHRLNVDNELSDTVLHEARHAWQNSQRARRVGVNDDMDSATPRNDDDLDLLIEVVQFTSADIITEAVNGTGDNSPDLNERGVERGIDQWETDAPNFAGANKNLCP